MLIVRTYVTNTRLYNDCEKSTKYNWVSDHTWLSSSTARVRSLIAALPSTLMASISKLNGQCSRLRIWKKLGIVSWFSFLTTRHCSDHCLSFSGYIHLWVGFTLEACNLTSPPADVLGSAMNAMNTLQTFGAADPRDRQISQTAQTAQTADPRNQK